MIKLNIKKITAAMLVLSSVGFLGGCSLKNDKSASASVTKNNNDKQIQDIDLLQMSSAVNDMSIVGVSKNDLVLYSLKETNKAIKLNSGGTFNKPVISPEKNAVAYLKDNNLYVTTNRLENIKIAENVPDQSFAWQDGKNLIYSPPTGGLYNFNVLNKTSSSVLKNEYNYQNITSAGSGKLYAEQYRYYKESGNDKIQDYGIMYFNPATKEQKIVVKSIPSKADSTGDLGMYPVISGISTDFKYLYLWKHPHSGSLAADGVEFMIYDILSSKLIDQNNKNIISLGYKDNWSQNPKDSKILAFIYGNNRIMSMNKQLIKLDVVTGKFEALLPKGIAAMTPYYSNDGNTILYGASPEQKDINEDMTNWMFNGKHHIYSIDTSTKKIKQLTNNVNYFDFGPRYLDSKVILFFRVDKNYNISLWKLENGKETMLAENLGTDPESLMYYGHYDTDAFIDIK